MRHFRQQFTSMHRALLLIPAIALILVFGAGAARAEEYIHGDVKTSSLTAGETYRADGDMVLTIDKDVEINKLIMNHTVTVKGNGTLTITQGILGASSNMVINSGTIKISFESDAESFSSAIDLGSGSLTLNGGTLDVKYRSTGKDVYTVSAVESAEVTVNGGTLIADCDTLNGHATAINTYVGFTLTGGKVICKAETHNQGKSASLLYCPPSDADACFLMTGGTLEAISTSEIQGYGIDWTSRDGPATAIIKGGTLKAKASYAGLRTWAPLTISDGAHVELEAFDVLHGIALDAEETTVTVSGKETYVKAINNADNTRYSAVCAKGFTLDEKYQSIAVPADGFFLDNGSTKEEYGYIVGPNWNKAAEVEITPKKLYSLTATVWNEKTGKAVSEASGIEIIYNKVSCGKPHYTWDVEANSRFTLDLNGIPSGWTWKGWTIGSPDSYIREGTENSTVLSDSQGAVSIHCYAIVSGDEPGSSGNDETKPGSETPAPTEEELTPGADGTNIGKGASFKLADTAIRKAKGEEDLAGSVFRLLKLTSPKQTKTSVTLAWDKVSGAKKYVIYGSLCGKSSRMTKLAEAGASVKSKTIKTASKKLVKGRYYKFLVVALDKNDKVLSTSKIAHVATSGGKVGNIKKVTIQAKLDKTGKKLKKYKTLSSLVLKKGTSVTLKVVAEPASKKLPVTIHRAISFESSKAAVAAVTGKGKVTAKKKGSCYIYAYAQNGVYARIKITVP